MKTKNKLLFPLFNAVVGLLFGALIGYYISRLGISILLGGLVGLLLGLATELLLGSLGADHWFYKRRVLLLVLVEVFLAVFVLGPYAFAFVETQPNQHTVCCETPLDYGAEEYEDIQIAASDGVILAGWYVPPNKKSGAVIILLHGARSDRRDTAWHAHQLIDAGYGVLLYDQRALGESTGNRVSFGWDNADLLAVMDYLASRSDVDPNRIGVVGLSGGGHIALNAAYQNPDRIAALWLDGIGAQQIEDFPTPESIGERFATLINASILKMIKLRLGHSAPPPFSQIFPQLDQPDMMIVASGLDDFEYRVNQQYIDLVAENTQVWLIEDAHHVGGPAVIPDEYRQRMLQFFENAWEQ